MEKKLDWIVSKDSLDEYPVKFYREFLEYIKSKYDGKYWHVLPKEVAILHKKNLSNIRKYVVKK